MSSCFYFSLFAILFPKAILALHYNQLVIDQVSSRISHYVISTSTSVVPDGLNLSLHVLYSPCEKNVQLFMLLCVIRNLLTCMSSNSCTPCTCFDSIGLFSQKHSQFFAGETNKRKKENATIHFQDKLNEQQC